MIRLLLPWLALLFALLAPLTLGRIHRDPNHVMHSVLPAESAEPMPAATRNAID